MDDVTLRSRSLDHFRTGSLIRDWSTNLLSVGLLSCVGWGLDSVDWNESWWQLTSDNLAMRLSEGNHGSSTRRNLLLEKSVCWRKNQISELQWKSVYGSWHMTDNELHSFLLDIPCWILGGFVSKGWSKNNKELWIEHHVSLWIISLHMRKYNMRFASAKKCPFWNPTLIWEFFCKRTQLWSLFTFHRHFTPFLCLQCITFGIPNFSAQILAILQGTSLHQHKTAG